MEKRTKCPNHGKTLKQRLLKQAKGTFFTKGKYKGKTIEEVIELDPGYIQWASTCLFFRKSIEKEAITRVIYSSLLLSE
jgi:hypothetical protein